jgi:hypothetical protein
MAFVNFADTQLQACFERNLAEVDAADELRQVRALMLTHAWFRMLEGPHSDRVHDTIEVLLSRELRSGLLRWYRRPDASQDAEAITFRDELSQLAGEKFAV